MDLTSPGLLFDWQDLTDNCFPSHRNILKSWNYQLFVVVALLSAREQKSHVQRDVIAAFCGFARGGHTMQPMSHPTLCSQTPCGLLGIVCN